mmetsp:Transcript_5955/g.12681  ORF Transcript_5955/g.12681 Transcript_5955/m.12681 type:complete len:640 (-) Transcript_5955:23-1942(-)
MESEPCFPPHGEAGDLVETSAAGVGGGKAHVLQNVGSVRGPEVLPAFGAGGISLPADGALSLEDPRVGDAGGVGPPLGRLGLGGEVDEVVEVRDGHGEVEDPHGVLRSVGVHKFLGLGLCLARQIPEGGGLLLAGGHFGSGAVGKGTEHEVHGSRLTADGLEGIRGAGDPAHVQALEHLEVAPLRRSTGIFSGDHVRGGARHRRRQGRGHRDALFAAAQTEGLGGLLRELPELEGGLASAEGRGGGSARGFSGDGGQGRRRAVGVFGGAVVWEDDRGFEALRGLVRDVEEGVRGYLGGTVAVGPGVAFSQDVFFQGAGHRVRDRFGRSVAGFDAGDGGQNLIHDHIGRRLIGDHVIEGEQNHTSGLLRGRLGTKERHLPQRTVGRVVGGTVQILPKRLFPRLFRHLPVHLHHLQHVARRHRRIRHERGRIRISFPHHLKKIDPLGGLPLSLHPGPQQGMRGQGLFHCRNQRGQGGRAAHRVGRAVRHRREGKVGGGTVLTRQHQELLRAQGAAGGCGLVGRRGLRDGHGGGRGGGGGEEGEGRTGGAEKGAGREKGAGSEGSAGSEGGGDEGRGTGGTQNNRREKGEEPGSGRRRRPIYRELHRGITIESRSGRQDKSTARKMKKVGYAPDAFDVRSSK